MGLDIPVIINNRDLVTWTKALALQISELDDVGEIIILDNASTYPQLLDWYDTCSYRIERLSNNLGHKAPWISGLVGELCDRGAPYYVITDPDLDISGVPKDCISKLIEGLEMNNMEKCGLSLNFELSNHESPWYKLRRGFDKHRVANADIGLCGVLKTPVDTTFAVWSPELQAHAILGGMLWKPYQARHIPWEYSLTDIKADPEYAYYMQYANNSCSLKDLAVKVIDGKRS